MKKLIGLLLFVAVAVSAFAEMTIRDLKATSIDPLGLAIDYNVSGAEAIDAMRSIKVEMTVGDKTYTAKNLVGAIQCVNGSHRVYWNMAEDGLSIDTTEASVAVSYEAGDGALYCVIDLSNGAEDGVTYPVTYLDAEPSGGFNTTEYKSTKLVLKRVDTGSFMMQGSTSVTLTKPFYMGIYEVTQKQWELVMESNPANFTDAVKPVEFVSYDDIRGSSNGAMWPTTNAVDASSFLGKLRKRTGIDFDLPTEAQWEYTCRAGTTTVFSYGNSANDDYMWYSNNSSLETHEVGTKKPNPWGFYDMHGNVWEWCLDWDASSFWAGENPEGATSGSQRVARSGCWVNDESCCTSSKRASASASFANQNCGFRLSSTIP